MKKIIASKRFYLPMFYIGIGILVYYILSNIVKKISKYEMHLHHGKSVDKRKITIIVLINNIVKYVIAIIVIMAILSVYGVNTTSIIASLGIVGVVVGLAFQDIVKDFLAGIFIIFDNQYAVGDFVKINGFEGELISLGLKTTKIKSYTGEVKILSNSSFSEVINYNLANDVVFLYLPVSYNVDIDKLESVLTDVSKEILLLKGVKEFNLLGIDSFDDSSMKYVVSIECVPMSKYIVKRGALKLIKKTFDKNKIEIPFNQMDVHIEK